MTNIKLNIKKIVDNDTTIEIEIVGTSRSEIVDTAKGMLTHMSKTY